MRSLKHSHGVTLVELMATLSAAVLVVTLAVPSFRGLHTGIQRTQVRYALMASFGLARSEAVRRAAPITLCPSNDGATCSTNPARDWSSGWIVKADTAGPPTVLDSARFSQVAFSLVPDGVLAQGVTFQSSGLPSASGRFSYQDDNGTCELRLTPIGRMEAAASESECL